MSVDIDSTIVSAIIVGVPTAILAGITYKYMVETKRIREATQLPNFSIEPATYLVGGSFIFLNLVNSGRSATNIDVECSWGKTNHLDHSKRFHVISLSTNGRANLDVPMTDIMKEKYCLKVDITCKDITMKEYKTSFDFNFDRIDSELAYQHDPLERIAQALSEIKNKLKQ